MRKLKWLVVILALAGAAAFAAWKLLAPPVVEAAQPSRGPAVEAVYATGLVEPELEIRIAPRVGGKLVELHAYEGDEITKGELLARLDDADLRAAVAELDAQVGYAKALAERNAQLAQTGVVARDTADRSQADLDAARASLLRAREQVRHMRIVAPADGRIIRRDGEIGEFLPVNETLFYMAARGPLRITAEVDEEDIPRLETGLPVVIRSDAFPERVFDGHVSQITPRGDPIARSYRVRIALDGEPPLRIGMTTETNIIVAERQNALLVPSGAVSNGAVWIAVDGFARARGVETGVVGPGQTEILGGLDGSELVLTDPPAGIEDGARIRLAGQN